MDKCLPFFKTLKQAVTWMEECEKAFQELKYYLSNPPLLSPSKEGEDLYLYLAVSSTTVSAALIREEDGTQLLVYYISQAFQGAKAKYPRIEKIAFALIAASRKLRPYFQADPILVMMDQPIMKSMNRPKALVDFIAEFTVLNEDRALDEAERWMVQTDGSSARKKGGARVIIITPKGETLKYEVKLMFPATNNEAEYEAILTRLRVRKALGAKNLLLQSNSKLVIGQIKEEYEANEEMM
ncbi:uncharacterized protein LOC142632875 [Castanea sativa]|uniref:uncharacterized protein LOC142632875 n=1 Tax=Castanea sativa TaxID=21020 RepID=UPI003F6532B7